MNYRKFALIQLALLMSCSNAEKLTPEPVIGSSTMLADSTKKTSSLRLISTESNTLPPVFKTTEFTDKSKKVIMKIFVSPRYCGAYHRITIPVTTGYVLTGGGGYIDNWQDDYKGAYLTETRPDANLKNYYVSSNSLTSETHCLTAYAVGIKIAGVSEATLRANMKLVSKKLGVIPTAGRSIEVAELPIDHKLIGGGASTEEKAPITASIVNGNRWLAEAMVLPSGKKTFVTAYSIGIKDSFLKSNRLSLTTSYYQPEIRLQNLYDTFDTSYISCDNNSVLTSLGGRNQSSSTAYRGTIRLFPTSGTSAKFQTKHYLNRYVGTNNMSIIGIKYL